MAAHFKTPTDITICRVAVDERLAQADVINRQCSEVVAKGLETIDRSLRLLAVSAPRYP